MVPSTTSAATLTGARTAAVVPDWAVTCPWMTTFCASAPDAQSASRSISNRFI
jgi:hypothetical protein